MEFCPVRTKETFLKYKEYLQRDPDFVQLKESLNNPLKDFGFWILIEDNYPWDNIAKVHHLLFPKRVFCFEKDMNEEERENLNKIISDNCGEYELIVRKLDLLGITNRSVKWHYHIHLLKLKTYRL